MHRGVFNMLMGGLSAPNGQQIWTAPGVYSFVVPELVRSLSIVCIGGGGGGGYHVGGAGGNLRYITPTAVVPGETLRIVVGAGGSGSAYSATAGGDSTISRTLDNVWNVIFSSTAAIGTSIGGGVVGGGNGGPGGAGGVASGGAYGHPYNGGGGGGAGGYSGNGGAGGNSGNGSGGYGGGASGGKAGVGTATDSSTGYSFGNVGSSGGGVGLYGEGTSGVITGENGSWISGQTACGAGGGAGYEREGSVSQENRAGQNGTAGGVRIIWGDGRSYPSTRIADEK